MTIDDPETTGTYGARAPLAAALEQERDFTAEAADITRILESAGIQSGATMLMIRCGSGGLLDALRERFAVAGCDPYDARLMLARRRLSGVPLWQCSLPEVAAEWPAQVVLLCEPEQLSPDLLAQTVRACAQAMTPDGVLMLCAGPSPESLRAGTALMHTHDGPGLKIVRSAVVRRSGSRARLRQHWMVARDHRGVESFVEQHTLHLHSAETITAALSAAGLHAIRYAAEALPGGLWIGKCYAGTGALD